MSCPVTVAKASINASSKSAGVRGVSARSFVFPGGHEWTETFRAALGEFLRETCPTR